MDMLLIIYTSSAIFVYPLLKSFDRKNRIYEQFSLKLLVRKFLLLETVQRFSRDLLSIHKEERKYFQAPQFSYHNYVSLVFSTSTRRRNLVQMPIISGDSWKRLSIIANSYLLYMWREHMPITSVTSLVKPGIITLTVGVLKKTCSENMQQIYRETPLPKCAFCMGVLL